MTTARVPPDMLPNNIARCNGQTDSRGRTAAPCIACERRTAERPERCWMTNGRMHPGNTYCEDRIPSMTVFDVRQQNLKQIKVLDTPAVISAAREFLQSALDEQKKMKASSHRAPSRSVSGLKFNGLVRSA